MNVSTWLGHALSVLNNANIATARLDSLVLIEDCLQKDRAMLLAHPEIELTAPQEKLLMGQLMRRTTNEPLAYIRGRSEFYGRDLIVNHHVLEPRPESETIIDLLKAMKVPKKCVIADIGTGSGALAITAALELPNVTVLAVDIDPNCLLVARKNANKYDVAVQFFEGNLLAPLANLPVPMLSNIILCNLPYVPDEFHINVAAMHEPKLAIFGGTDGLDYYRTLFDQINSLDTKPSYILTESLPSQHPALLSIAAQYGYKQQVEDDFIQLFTRL